jgi:integrase
VAVRRVHTFLSIAFNQAIRWEIIAANPTRGVLLPKARRKEARVMALDEAKRFIKACRTDDRFIIFRIRSRDRHATGRVLALTWKDIDFDERTVRVSRAIATGLKGGGFEVKEPKTVTSRRLVSFSEQLKERLLLHKQNQEKAIERVRAAINYPVLLKHKQAKGVNYLARKKRNLRLKAELSRFEHNDLVFPSETGGYMSRFNINRREFAESP